MLIFGAVPIGSVLPNDCPTPIIKWLSII